MSEQSPPPRRWFQFSLSTWFVLMAIVAWAMMEWPWVRATTGSRAAHPDEFVEPTITIAISIPDQSTQSFHWLLIMADSLRILYPALALAAFVGWKAAWAIVWRVKGRKEGRPICSAPAHDRPD